MDNRKLFVQLREYIETNLEPQSKFTETHINDIINIVLEKYSTLHLDKGINETQTIDTLNSVQ